MGWQIRVRRSHADLTAAEGALPSHDEGAVSAGKVRVAKSFPPDFFNGLTLPPLVMRPGDVLSVQPDQSEAWPAFVLVVNAKGERGWVHRRYLRPQGAKAFATRRYDTATLNPSVGEVLTVIEEDLESGWLWCRDRSGNLGWFAIDHLAPPGAPDR